MTAARQLELPADGGVTATASDPNLCAICLANPRLGALSRCKACLCADAAKRLQAVNAAKTHGTARAQTPQTAPSEKRCFTCKVIKSLDEFGSHHRARDGRRKSCRVCVRAGRALSKPLRPEQAEVQKRAASKPERRERNRHAVRSWAKRNPRASLARQKLMRARRRGDVMPPATCQIAECESTSLIAHHWDYNQPFDVLHTCRRHHRQLHHGVALKLKPGVPARLKRLPPTGNSAPTNKKAARSKVEAMAA